MQRSRENSKADFVHRLHFARRADDTMLDNTARLAGGGHYEGPDDEEGIVECIRLAYQNTRGQRTPRSPPLNKTASALCTPSLRTRRVLSKIARARSFLCSTLQPSPKKKRKVEAGKTRPTLSDAVGTGTVGVNDDRR